MNRLFTILLCLSLRCYFASCAISDTEVEQDSLIGNWIGIYAEQLVGIPVNEADEPVEEPDTFGYELSLSLIIAPGLTYDAELYAGDLLQNGPDSPLFNMPKMVAGHLPIARAIPRPEWATTIG